MTRTEFLTYIKRTFKREDKDTELIDALNDTLYDMSTRYDFQVSQTETEITLNDSDYKYDYPSGYAFLISNLKYIDSGGGGRTLNQLTKEQFDDKYPDISSSNADKGDPIDYTIYGNEIFIAPYLQTVTTQKLYISGSNVASELGESDSPDYEDRFREVIKFGTLYRAYSDLDLDDKAAKYKNLYDEGMEKMINIDDKKGNGIEQVYMDLI